MLTLTFRTGASDVGGLCLPVPLHGVFSERIAALGAVVVWGELAAHCGEMAACWPHSWLILWASCLLLVFFSLGAQEVLDEEGGHLGWGRALVLRGVIRHLG